MKIRSLMIRRKKKKNYRHVNSSTVWMDLNTLNEWESRRRDVFLDVSPGKRKHSVYLQTSRLSRDDFQRDATRWKKREDPPSDMTEWRDKERKRNKGRFWKAQEGSMTMGGTETIHTTRNSGRFRR